MAREYAPVKVSIWADDDFRALSVHAQHLYFLLLTSPTLNHAGVADWRTNRIAALAGGWTIDEVEAAGEELEQALYVVIDWTTDEALIRSFVRHDGLMKQPKMAVSMANAHAGIASAGIRGVIVHELKRVKEEAPNLSGWGSEAASDLLSKRSVDPSTYPLVRRPQDPVSGSVSGSSTPKATPKPAGSVSGSVFPVPNPLPTPTTTTSNQQPAATAVAEQAEQVRAVWVQERQLRKQHPSKQQKIDVGNAALEALEHHPFELVIAAARRAGRGGFVRLDIEISKMTAEPQPPPQRAVSAREQGVADANTLAAELRAAEAQSDRLALEGGVR